MNFKGLAKEWSSTPPPSDQAKPTFLRLQDKHAPIISIDGLT